MNHSKILKRAWHILWNYKTLWIFGIILAITAPSPGNQGAQFRTSGQDFQNSQQWPMSPEIHSELRELEQLLNSGFTEANFQAWVAVGIAVLCLVFLLFIAFAIFRYVSQVAMIRMVDQYERSGEKVNWRSGFRLGWSRSAWRLFLFNLLVVVIMAVVFIGLFAFVSIPVLLGVMGGGKPSIVGIIATIGLAFMVIFLAIIISTALSLFYEIYRRVVVLEDAGVVEAFRLGWQFLRRNFKDTFLMWLLLLGIRIGTAILMIPIVFLVLGIGLVVGGGTGAGLFFAVQALASTGAGVAVAVTIGLILFITVIVVPMAFLGGLRQTYFSSAWTLTYRELKFINAGEGILDDGRMDDGDTPEIEMSEPLQGGDELAESGIVDQEPVEEEPEENGEDQ